LKTAKSNTCFYRLSALKTAAKVRKAAFGDEHRGTATAYRSLGMVYFLLNKNENASTYLQDYARVMERQEPEYQNDTGFVVALIMLSDIQTACGKHKQAKKALYMAKEVCKGASQQQQQQQQLLQQSPSLWIPKLESMVDERRCVPTPSLLTRMHDIPQQEGDVVLEHNPSEISVFRQLVLTVD
jgi:hypothetical protein